MGREDDSAAAEVVGGMIKVPRVLKGMNRHEGRIRRAIEHRGG
jgi:hypothetical protein